MPAPQTAPKSKSPVRDLRQAAVAEVDSLTTTEGKVDFDAKHSSTPPITQATTEDFERDNGVSQYPGQNSPHIGNGSGGRR